MPKYKKSDFPLKPYDRRGFRVGVGDMVGIVTIPKSDFRYFPTKLGQAHFKSLRKQVLKVRKIDKLGFLIFECWYVEGPGRYYSYDFSFDPKHVELVIKAKGKRKSHLTSRSRRTR